MTTQEPSEALAPNHCPCHQWAGLDLADWPDDGHHRLCDGRGGRRRVRLTPRSEPYRFGNHNPRNIYLAGVDRDTDEHVGVMFTPERGRLVVIALNALLGGLDAKESAEYEQPDGLREHIARVLHDAATGKICPDPDDPTPYGRMAEAVRMEIIQPLLRRSGGPDA